MTELPTRQNAANSGLTESHVDSMLRSFFRLEVPHELQASGDPQVVPGRLAIVRLNKQLRPELRRRRWSVLVSIGALGICVAWLSIPLSVQSDSQSAQSQLKSLSRDPEQSDQMLVSPNGDSPSSSFIAVDGATLMETDSIRLSPESRDDPR
jgi:hypothetical protein